MEDTAGSIAKRARVLALVATFVVPTGCECGADAPSEVPVEEPVAASGARLDGELAVGAYHGCVVRGGRVLCWGMGSEGQLGDGTTRSRGEAAPVVDLDGAVGVTVGWGHGCAWREDGTARCWGHSDRDDPDDINTRPRPVRGLSDVTSMLGMPSSSRTCAIYGEGSVRCFDFEAWGSDEGTALESVHGVDDAVQLALHSDYGCARTNAGAVACWYFDGEPPIEAQELIPSGVQRIAMDPEGYALLVIDGAARRWTPFDGEPVLVEGLREVVDVSAGEGFDCVLDASGAVRRWADADRDLDAAFGPRPEPVGELGSARAIAGVGASRCALVGDAVRCWGGADLWIPDTYASATEVPDISDAAEIGAGGEITCARHADGGVSCWGRS